MLILFAPQCETWCSKDRLHRAKTIDLCQNPLTVRICPSLYTYLYHLINIPIRKNPSSLVLVRSLNGRSMIRRSHDYLGVWQQRVKSTLVWLPRTRMCWQAPQMVQVMAKTLKAKPKNLQNLREIEARNWTGRSSRTSFEVEYLACVYIYIFTSGSPSENPSIIDCLGPNWPLFKYWILRPLRSCREFPNEKCSVGSLSDKNILSRLFIAISSFGAS